MNLSESLAANSDMTLPKAESEALMNLASSSLISLHYQHFYIEFVFFTLSEPAKSMSDRVECIYSELDIFFEM